VAGKEHQRHIRPLGVGAKVVQRPAHPLQVAVGLQPDLEPQALQQRLDRAGIVDRIVQLADLLVILGRQHQGNAPFGERRRGEPEDHRDNEENAAQHRVNPIPWRALCPSPPQRQRKTAAPAAFPTPPIARRPP
jgi:hypothetical protein